MTSQPALTHFVTRWVHWPTYTIVIILVLAGVIHSYESGEGYSSNIAFWIPGSLVLVLAAGALSVAVRLTRDASLTASRGLRSTVDRRYLWGSAAGIGFLCLLLAVATWFAVPRTTASARTAFTAPLPFTLKNLSSPNTPQGSAKTSWQPCLSATDPGVTNNTHGLISITGGSGSFAAVSASNNTITVAPDTPLSGNVTMTVINNGPPSAVAPLIGTPSWGSDSSSYWSVNNSVPTGTSTQTSVVSLRAPSTPGIYHILFAFQLELGADHVASATNWAVGADKWNDGNDIAQFSPTQIAEAQRFGCAADDWLMQTGMKKLLVPSDAITVIVEGS